MWDDVKALNAAAATLATLAAVAILAGLVARVARLPAFAIREVVVVTPVDRADAAYVEAVVREELSGTFFTLDFDDARRALAEVPWVRHVALRRQWPSRLEISLEEYTPLARWNEDSLVDPEGNVFDADYDGELPRFEGPEGSSGELVGHYRGFVAMIEPLGLVLTGLRLTPRGSWSLTASRGAGSLSIELGRGDTDARLARFAAAYPRTLGALAQRGTLVDHVDLRYRSGFAARMPQAAGKPARKLT